MIPLFEEFSSTSDVMIAQQSAGVRACDAEAEGKLVIYTFTTFLNDMGKTSSKRVPPPPPLGGGGQNTVDGRYI